MHIKIERKAITKILFDFLLVSTLICYIGYYLYSRDRSINVYMLYSNYDRSFAGIGLIAKIIRFSKDIIIFLLFTWSIMFVKKRKQLKLLLGSVLFYAFGITVALANGYSGGSIISGIRAYLYFIVLLNLFYVIDDKSLSVKSILRITTIGCLINILVCSEQALRGTSGQLFLAGHGGYRFPGLFGGVNGLSGFATGAALFVFIADYKKNLRKKYVAWMYTMCLLMSIMGGTRSGMVNILIIIYVWVIARVQIKNAQKIFITLMISAIAIPLIIIFSSNLAGRGSILQVQLESGRLNILADVLKNANPFQLIFGRGLGVGSNSDMLLNQVNELSGGRILDGTFNVIIFQYGLVGLVAAGNVFYVFIKKMKDTTDLLTKWLFTGTVLLQCLTGNIFETYGFLILIFACYQLLTGNKIV